MGIVAYSNIGLEKAIQPVATRKTFGRALNDPAVCAMTKILVLGIAIPLAFVSSASSGCQMTKAYSVDSLRQAETVVRAKIVDYQPPRQTVCQLRYGLTRDVNEVLNCLQYSGELTVLERDRATKANFKFEVIETLKGERRLRWNLHWANSTFGFPAYWDRSRDVIFGIAKVDGSSELEVMQTGCTTRSIIDASPENVFKVKEALGIK